MTRRLSALLFLFVIPVGAQPKDDSSLLPPDHPELHSTFCFFMNSFSAWLDERAVTDPTRRTILMDGAAAYIKVTPSDFPKVAEACRSLTSDLEHLTTEAKGSPSRDARTVEVQLERRQATIRRGAETLQQTLSETSWNGLQKHINGEHRTSIRKVDPNSRRSPQ